MIHGDDGDADIGKILQIVQNNFRIWQGLLHASGGMLNPPKCSWTPFIWKYNQFGHVRLTTMPTDLNAQLYASDLNGMHHTLQINKPTDVVRLLGVHITADGNSNKELCILKQKQQKYVQLLLHTPLSKQEAQVIYIQCYLPTVTYPLPATNMPPSKIYDTQCSITSLFLTRMGYPRHLPRCIVYAPEMIGGLGMRHLGHEQGIQQTLQLLRHLRANSTNGKLYSLTINQYQIYAGTHQPILEDTKEIGWMPKGWFSSIQEFLHITNSKILLQHPWAPTDQWTHNQCIMDDAMQHLTDPHLETINSVRMYLHVFMLSDITDSNRKALLPSIIDGSASPITSPLVWPYQPPPSPAAWRVWSTAIRTIYTSSTTSLNLQKPLGPWILQSNHLQREWTWFACPITLKLFQKHGCRWYVYLLANQSRRYAIYATTYSMIAQNLPPTATPATPVYMANGHDIIVHLPIHPWLPVVGNMPQPDQSNQPDLDSDSDSEDTSDDKSTQGRSILDCLMSPPTDWENELWHCISCHS